MDNRVQGFYESAVEQAGDAVKSQPVAAVIVAVGLGIVAGMLVVGLLPSKPCQREWNASEIGSRALESGSRAMERLGKLTPSSWMN